MNRLIISTTMTVDGVISVGEWYVSEGEHDRAARDQFVEAAAMLLGRKTYEASRASGRVRPVDGRIGSTRCRSSSPHAPSKDRSSGTRS